MAYCGPRGIELEAFLRWSPHSQQSALDWQAYENRRCRNCGIHPDDIDDGSFHAHLQQCKGCQARERVADSKEAQDGRGVSAFSVPWAASDCPRCQPDDDD
jgi:hypothetical protein